MLRHQDDHDEWDLKSRHHCTDVPCCLGFLVSLVAMGFLYSFSIKQGNIGRLYHGINYNGHICGVDDSVALKPFLYWCSASGDLGSSKLNIAMDKPICVSSCPGSGDGLLGLLPVEPDCALVTGPGGLASYKTMLVLDRYCIPDTGLYKDVAAQLSQGQLGSRGTTVMEAMSSIPAAWPLLVGAFLASVVFGYIYLVVLRHCAKMLIWLTMIATVAGFALLGVYLWVNAGRLSAKLPNGHKLPAGLEDNEEQATKVAAIVCWVLSCIFVCVACCFHGGLEAAIAAVEVACEAMFEMPSLLITPLLKALIKVALFVGLVYGFLMLLSTAHITGTSKMSGLTRHFSLTNNQIAALCFYALNAFWILAFASAFSQFVVAYAIAEYYYAPIDHDGEKDVGCCSVWDGAHVALQYHCGSLAMGSFLLACFQLLQKIIEAAEWANKTKGGNNQVVACLLCIGHCLVSCCKQCVEFINKNAYIDMAVTSNNFCEAAKSALGLIARVGGSMAFLNGATFVFTVFGTLLISLASAAFAYALATNGQFASHTSRFHVDDPTMVMVVAAFIGFFVALTFMNVFDMASDTLLYCYGLDLSKGTGAHTAPAHLRALLHENDFTASRGKGGHA